MIITCSCKHVTQDEFYGKGLRVHNPVNKDYKIIGWRCTVCLSVKQNEKKQ